MINAICGFMGVAAGIMLLTIGSPAMMAMLQQYTLIVRNQAPDTMVSHSSLRRQHNPYRRNQRQYQGQDTAG